MPHGQTNIEFVSNLMNFSRYGPLAQVFVIQALTHYSEAVAKADPARVDTPFVTGDAWVGVAKEIKAKLEEGYGVRVVPELVEKHRGEVG